jgi:hypothetical protein
LQNHSGIMSSGYVYNSLKIRAGFWNRIKIFKDELAKLDKNKKSKPAGYVEDTSIT